MDLKRKDEIAKSAITSISRHDDEDAAVRKTALLRLSTFISDELAEINARVDARNAALFGDE